MKRKLLSVLTIALTVVLFVCALSTTVSAESITETPTVSIDKFNLIFEDNVWVSARTCITPGVTIGEGAVIAVGAVVTKDIPKGAVVVGNPAKVLKYRDMEKYYQLKAEKKFQYLGRK